MTRSIGSGKTLPLFRSAIALSGLYFLHRPEPQPGLRRPPPSRSPSMPRQMFIRSIHAFTAWPGDLHRSRRAQRAAQPDGRQRHDRLQLVAQRGKPRRRLVLREAIPSRARFLAKRRIRSFRTAGQRTPSRCSPCRCLVGSPISAANRTILPSFSVAKYGPQCATDPYFSDAGTGSRPIAAPSSPAMIRTNSYVKDSPALEQKWIKHLVKTWGSLRGVESNIIHGQRGEHLVFGRIVTRIPKARTRSISRQSSCRIGEDQIARPERACCSARRMGLGRLFLQRLRPAICRQSRLQEVSGTTRRSRTGWITSLAAQPMEGGGPSGGRGERAFLPAGWRIQRRRL